MQELKFRDDPAAMERLMNAMSMFLLIRKSCLKLNAMNWESC